TGKYLVSEFRSAGVLGGGRIAKAVEILSEMFSKKEYMNILALAGPLVPGGMRGIIRGLVAEGFIHAIVSTGANVAHDLIEAFGFKHIIGKAEVNDKELSSRGIGRIYDIFIGDDAFEALEKNIHRILEGLGLTPDEKENLATYELLHRLGEKLEDEESIVKTSAERGIPIFCPAIYDSILGMSLWTYSQVKGLKLNPFLDFTKLEDLIHEAESTGLIILGGGTPKHYALLASMMSGGVDLAVQITMDRPEAGGLSGAPLEEAISWKKVSRKGKVASVIGDATILFPLLVSAALPRLNNKIKI
ncbi:MAG: deoxyhypusine synthase family protein, partial [Candidatus Bathyarchaeia archaeon]